MTDLWMTVDYEPDPRMKQIALTRHAEGMWTVDWGDGVKDVYGPELSVVNHLYADDEVPEIIVDLAPNTELTQVSSTPPEGTDSADQSGQDVSS